MPILPVIASTLALEPSMDTQSPGPMASRPPPSRNTRLTTPSSCAGSDGGEGLLLLLMVVLRTREDVLDPLSQSSGCPPAAAGP